jgi:hypothetical protein
VLRPLPVKRFQRRGRESFAFWHWPADRARGAFGFHAETIA